MQATRPGHVWYVDVAHGDLPGPSCVGPSELIDLIWDGDIDPGKMFDLTPALAEVVEGYRAMDERRAFKTLLCP